MNHDIDIEKAWDNFIEHLNKIEPLGSKQNPHAKHTAFIGAISRYKKIFIEANRTTDTEPNQQDDKNS